MKTSEAASHCPVDGVLSASSPASRSPLGTAELVLHYGLLATVLAARVSVWSAASGTSTDFALHRWFGLAVLALLAASWWEEWLAQGHERFALRHPHPWLSFKASLVALCEIALGRGDARGHWRQLMPLLMGTCLLLTTLVVTLGLLSTATADSPAAEHWWLRNMHPAHEISATLLMLLLVADLWLLLCRWLHRPSTALRSDSTRTLK